jgi:ABC-2 type transport system permease protein
MSGFPTLLYKELLRFWKVSFQTVAAPILTALLYLLIFSHVLADHVQVYEGVRYTAFLVPGLVMMSVLQNAFANTSSSLIQSKISGSVIFMLVPPLSYLEFFAAYVLAAVVRGLVVGLGVLICTLGLVDLQFQSPLWIFAFALAGSALLGSLGLIAAVWADKYEQIAAFQNFIIMPLTFLFDSFLAAFLAAIVTPESVFLHDRRFSLRFFRCLRYQSGCFAGHRRRLSRGPDLACPRHVALGLQAARLSVGMHG